MDKHLCIVVFIFATQLYFGAASLRLDVSPAQLEFGSTALLTVNCTFSYGNDSVISGINSLSISRADGHGNPDQTFQELASINAFVPDVVNQPSNGNNVSTAGSLDINGDSYLTLQWTYPSPKEVGVYRCDASGMDDTGHPTDLSVTANVTENEVDLKDLLEMFRALQTQTDDLINRISVLDMAVTNTVTVNMVDMNDQISKLDTKFNASFETLMASTMEMAASLTKLEEFESTVNTTMQATRDAMFIASEEYMDRMYFLSKHTYRDADVAEATCLMFGGYLLELDDSAEHDFIKNFTGSFDYLNGVLTGATDEDTEGVWVYRYSNEVMNYTAWYGDEPNTDSHDCMILYKYDLWKMADNDCHHTDSSYHFICEIPKD